MRVIIAGSRSIADREVVFRAIEQSGFGITEVISGTARGVDRLGEDWALEHQIPLKRVPADWDIYGRRAGFLRNIEMAKAADALILVWDGTSQGSRHMLSQARRHGLKVHEVVVSRGDQ